MAGSDGRAKFAQINRENQLDPLNYRNGKVQSMNWYDLALGSFTTNYATVWGRNLDRTTLAGANQQFPSAANFYQYFVQKAGREIGARYTFSARNSTTAPFNIIFNPGAPGTLAGYNIVGKPNDAGPPPSQYAVSVPANLTYDITLELKAAPPQAVAFDVIVQQETSSGGGSSATTGQAFFTYMTTTQSRGIGWKEVRTVVGGNPAYVLEHTLIPTDAASVPVAPLYINSDLQAVINNVTDASAGYAPISASLLARFSAGIAFTGNQITGTVYQYQYTDGVADPVVSVLGTATFANPATTGVTDVLTIPITTTFTDFFVGANVKIAAEWTIPIAVTGTVDIIGTCWQVNYNYPG